MPSRWAGLFYLVLKVRESEEKVGRIGPKMVNESSVSTKHNKKISVDGKEIR